LQPLHRDVLALTAGSVVPPARLRPRATAPRARHRRLGRTPAGQGPPGVIGKPLGERIRPRRHTTFLVGVDQGRRAGNGNCRRKALRIVARRRRNRGNSRCRHFRRHAIAALSPGANCSDTGAAIDPERGTPAAFRAAELLFPGPAVAVSGKTARKTWPAAVIVRKRPPPARLLKLIGSSVPVLSICSIVAPVRAPIRLPDSDAGADSRKGRPGFPAGHGLVLRESGSVTLPFRTDRSGSPEWQKLTGQGCGFPVAFREISNRPFNRSKRPCSARALRIRPPTLMD
jgi:hypothetical protein